MRTTRQLVICSALMAALLVATANVVIASDTAAAAQANGSLELVAQSAWADDGGVFDLQVRVAGADPGSIVRVAVHEPWVSRAAHRNGVRGDADPLLEIGPLPLDSLQETSNEILSLEIAIVGPDTPAPGDIDIGDDFPEDDPLPVLRTEGTSGVYPLEIVLESADGERADSILTSLIELPRGRAAGQLQVVTILPVELPNGLDANGIYALPEEAGAGLGTIADAIGIHPESRVALDIAPESLAALARSSAPRHVEITEVIRTHTDSDELLANPYVRVEQQAWIDAGLGEELAELYDAGQRSTQIAIGVGAEGSVVVLDEGIDPGGLDWLLDQGIQGAIVPTEQLDPLDGAQFANDADRQFLLSTTAGRRMPALEADARLRRWFTESGSPVLDANRFLADLTLLALANPDVRRSAVITAPADWQPNAGFLNVLLSGIERIPVLRSATPREALARTELQNTGGDGSISPPLRRSLDPVPFEPLGAFRTEYNQAAAAIESWSTVIEGDPDSTRRFRELLLVSSDERLTVPERTAYIEQIYALINEQKNRAIVTPAADTITLTGREADVPILVENRLDVPIAVTFVLDSEKLAFPEGKDMGVVLEPGQNRIEVPIEARANGDSPIRLQILSPDREVLLGTAQLSIRSFAFPGVGLAIGIGAVAILVVWWLRHRRTTRSTLEPALP